MTGKDNVSLGIDFSHRSSEIEECLSKPLLHIGDEIKFRDIDGKAYILKVMREAEE